MVIILYLRYIQNGAPKLLLMAQPLKHPQSESDFFSFLKFKEGLFEAGLEFKAGAGTLFCAE